MALSAFGVEDNRISKADHDNDAAYEAAAGGGGAAAGAAAGRYGRLPRKKRTFTPNVQTPLAIPKVLGGREVAVAPNRYVRALRIAGSKIPKGSGRMAAGAALGAGLGAGGTYAARRASD